MSVSVMGSKQQKASWYDAVYDPAIKNNYTRHYTGSAYFPIWAVVADRLTTHHDMELDDILEIGCGVGQFAHLLSDRGWRLYAGIDFSPVAIREAEKRCPDNVGGYGFFVDDACDSEHLLLGYDIVIMLEFLEHIEGDLELLARIPTDTHVYASVPNFNYQSHVRHFADADAVRARYGVLFTDFRVDPIVLNEDGITLFLFEGVRA